MRALQPVQCTLQQKYFSLEGYTVSIPGLQPGDSWKQEKFSLEGCTPAKMAGVKIAGMGRQPKAGGDGLNEKNRLFDPPFLKH